MSPAFLAYLCDPKTHEDLVLQPTLQDDSGRIIEGFLVSKSNRYPIVRGVPRFAGYDDSSNYTKSFGYQWNKWSLIQFERDNVGRPMEGHTRRMWERIVGRTDITPGSVIADYGCGPGRFLDVARSKGATVIGLDLSDAVEAAQEILGNDEHVLICQADILHSPLKPGSMDGTFSIGVLHHTPDARAGFADMVRSTKPGGWIGVSVYGLGGHYDNFITNLWRKLFKLLWPVLGHYPPLIYSYTVVYLTRPLYWSRHLYSLALPILGYIPRIQLRDIRWSVLDTFDSITPSNQYGFSLFQVFQWAQDEKLNNITPSNWAGASINATKSS